MKVESRLGQGLSAFFENNSAGLPVSKQSLNQTANTGEGDVLYIPLGNISANPNQPRRNFDEGQLGELAQSIEKNGVLQPILVRRKSANLFEIVAGERRWRAAKSAGIKEIPAIVKDLSDRQSFEIGLIENLQRENLSPMEVANGYKKLMTDFNYTQEDVASLVNKSRPYVTNMLRLLNLPGEVQSMVDKGDIPYTKARTLIKSDDPLRDAEAILKNDINVREAEKMRQKKQGGENDEALESELASLKENLENILSVDVDIKFNDNRGAVIIKFKNLSQLDAIITKLNNI
jgi:ParB family chromosome partitioning protein